MGKTIYSKCKELISKNYYKDDEIGSPELTELIMISIGGQPRTIKNAMRVMMQTKLIQDIGNCHFKIL